MKIPNIKVGDILNIDYEQEVSGKSIKIFFSGRVQSIHKYPTNQIFGFEGSDSSLIIDENGDARYHGVGKVTKIQIG